MKKYIEQNMSDIASDYETNYKKDNAYVFDRLGIFKQSPALRKEYKIPLWFGATWWRGERNERIPEVFNLGKSLMGLGFHSHSDSVNELLVGIKRWSMFDPISGGKNH
jgi:hypothetical protein